MHVQLVILVPYNYGRQVQPWCINKPLRSLRKTLYTHTYEHLYKYVCMSGISLRVASWLGSVVKIRNVLNLFSGWVKFSWNSWNICCISQYDAMSFCHFKCVQCVHKCRTSNFMLYRVQVHKSTKVAAVVY